MVATDTILNKRFVRTNHLTDLVAIDFFVVLTMNFKVLYIYLSGPGTLSSAGGLSFNVMKNPTDQWVAQQIIEAFPWDTAPRYLLRDRDAIYGERFRRRVHSLLIKEVITAPRSPWQNPYVERIIGSIRRDCLDFDYYHRWRTHLGLEMDTPQGRDVQTPDQGKVTEVPDLGGLHHHYLRLAA